LLPELVTTPGAQYRHLPRGQHKSTLEEVRDRFGSQTWQRERIFERLKRLCEIATECGFLRIYVQGSFVTEKPNPGDVDLALVTTFREPPDLSPDCDALLHADQCADRHGADLLWCEESSAVLEELKEVFSRCPATHTLRGSIELTL